MRGAAACGTARPRSEYGAIVVFVGLFCDQSMSTLPGRSALVIFDVTSFGRARSSSSATRRA